ncbi:unnamed protein product [Notodromas monacha]|uniref:Uncharacterized protein n=1 Tax=Notodromas monacha TaxID=399045 RepID=A0A7R9GE09_9CRUS|nr:unnamed protein product [Notodromas monacha]CAG0917539.1 unnamed protein product [Notodromas monacha]
MPDEKRKDSSKSSYRCQGSFRIGHFILSDSNPTVSEEKRREGNRSRLTDADTERPTAGRMPPAAPAVVAPAAAPPPPHAVAPRALLLLIMLLFTVYQSVYIQQC